MPLWIASQPLLLASRSDIRGKILAAAGLRFAIRPAQIDERATEDKAGYLVLGADQTLALGNKRFNKPGNRTEAAQQLRALRGQTHALHSALALVQDGKVLFELVDTARLTMRDFSDRFLDDYLDMAGDAALGSVGGYQLEGIGIHLFDRVEGDYFTILGLPLLPLLAYLRQRGFVDG